MNESLIRTRLRGFDFVFKTKPGVFSKHKIDAGTNLLIESLEIGPKDAVLDLGCGYGAVGIVAAKLACQGKVDLVDANIRAFKLARENIELNGVKNARAILSDGLEEVRDQKYDIVASNPPASLGLGIFMEFLEEAKRCLKPSGKIYFVTQERLKSAVERLFAEVFGNYDLVTRSRGYIISVALRGPG